MNRIIKFFPSRLVHSWFITGNYDVEIAFLEFLSTKVITGSVSSSLKIAWLHTDIFEHKGSTSLFLSKRKLIDGYQKFDKIICVSENTRSKFCMETNLYQNTITIYNPVDKNEVVRKSKIKCDLQKDENKFTIVTVGRLNEQKGYYRLCRVINKLIKKHNSIELWIIGEGEERVKLENYIKDNKLEKFIKLLGFKSNPYNYLSQADLFVSSSLVEGFSLALAEAIVLDIPVLCTNTAGPVDILENGKYGLIVDNDEDSIYKGLDEVLSNSNILIDLKQKASLRKNFFEIESTIKQIEDTFDFKRIINKNNDMFCTIFTPAYNRAYSLERLYQSLKKQNFKNFEWLVIDDGSSDNTSELFDRWIKEDNDFDIRYVKVENGGKQRAVNKGVELAKGKMFFIVDSDDYLKDDALEKIYEFEKTISDFDNFAGVSGYKGYENGQPIGSLIKKNYIDCTNNERSQYNLLGDKAEVYYTDLLKRYKFPEIDGEKFISESVVWNKIGADGYKVRWFDKIIYVCDYLEDGLTKQGMKLYKRNPVGYLIFIRNCVNYTNISFRNRLENYYGYYDAVKDELSLSQIACNLQTYVFMLKLAILTKKVRDIILRRSLCEKKDRSKTQ